MILPSKLENLKFDDYKSLVIIGGNGVGKTRLSIWIEKNNYNVHRISAQKSLKFPTYVSCIKADEAKKNLLLGSGIRFDDGPLSKMTCRWKNSPQNHELNDIENLIVFLFSDLSEKAIAEYQQIHFGEYSCQNNEALFLTLKSAWEKIFPTKKLKLESGCANITDGENEYSYTELSDGERGVLYFIGQCLATPRNGIMIIDEPENHLNKAILERTWTTIENIRPDCKFIYITHDLEFAKSREDAKKIWVRKYTDPEKWDLEILNDDNPFSEELVISIIGSRKNTLFIEGKNSKSYDKRLYSQLFPDYSIVPVNSCDKVKEITKAFNSMNNLHEIKAKGIIDRDRRSENEINKNKSSHIYSPKVAEIENLFLIPDVVKLFCLNNGVENIDSVIDEFKMDIIKYVQDNKEELSKLFIKNEFNNMIIRSLNVNDKTLDSYKERLNKIIDFEKLSTLETIYNEKIKNIIINNDIDGALEIINNKGLIGETKILKGEVLGMSREGYFNNVLRLIASGKSEGMEIMRLMKEYINID